jgi:hypothetical protein
MLDAWSSSTRGRARGPAPREVLREVFREALHRAVRAPSGHDRERWMCCLADGGVLEMHVDRICVPPGVDPAGRESLIDCGAALFRLCVALRALGYAPAVELLPDRAESDLLARVRLDASHAPTPADQAMVAAVARQGADGPVAHGRAIAPHVLSLLLGAARLEGAWLGFIDAPPLRRTLAGFVRLAGRSRQPPADGARVQRASSVAVLMTRGDTPADWLVAGHARARVLLTASAAGLSATGVNEPIAVPLLRSLVSGLVREAGDPGLPGRQGGMPLDAIPQLILCLSHAADRVGYDRSELPPQRPA